MRNMFLIMILCAVVWSCSEDDNPLSSEMGSGDDYEIYTKILMTEPRENNYLIILRDTTEHGYIDSFYVANIREKSPELLDQTVNDFNSKNESSIKLKIISGIENVVWKSEYKGDGKNTVKITLSRVGYGASNTQALVTIGAVYAPLAGSGHLFYLKKENGEWRIINKLMTWIS